MSLKVSVLFLLPQPRSEFEAAPIRDTREELGAFLWSGREVGALHGVESVNGVAHAGLEEVGFGCRQQAVSQVADAVTVHIVENSF